MRVGLRAVLLAAMVVGCGDDDNPPVTIDAPTGGIDGPTSDIDGGGGGDPDADTTGTPDGGSTTGSPVGAACATPDDCTGAFCIAEDMGFPMGYCSAIGCDLAAADTSCLPAGGDGLCLDIGDPGAPFGACFDQCDPAASDCRDGYYCADFGFAAICLPAPVCGDGIVDPPEECEPPGTPTCDDMCMGTGSAPTGAACVDTGECEGDFCIVDWPAGYCSQLGCDLGAPGTSCAATGGGVCVDVSDPADMMPFGACLDDCTAPADCRPGYECASLTAGGPLVCIPGGGGGGSGAVGAACMDVFDCAGDFCIADADGWPMGYCVATGCDLANPVTSCAAAGGDGICIDTGDPGMPFGVCFDQCAAPADCRTGYECVAFGPTSICLPAAGGGGGGTGVAGAMCTVGTDCMGNTCITDADGWPGGYCAHTPCTDDASCAVAGGDAVCINAGGTSICLDDCGADADCRAGYVCTNFGMGNRGCTP